MNRYYPAYNKDFKVTASPISHGKEICLSMSINDAEALKEHAALVMEANTFYPAIHAHAKALVDCIEEELKFCNEHQRKIAEIKIPLLIAATSAYVMFYAIRKQPFYESSFWHYFPALLEDSLHECSKKAARNFNSWFGSNPGLSHAYKPIFILIKWYEYAKADVGHKRRSKNLIEYLNQVTENSAAYVLSKKDLQRLIPSREDIPNKDDPEHYTPFVAHFISACCNS